MAIVRIVLLIAGAIAFQASLARSYAAPLSPLWRTYTSSSYYFSDYSYPKQTISKQGYLPGPQYCPDTGRTVCKDVEHYPSEQVYNVVMNSKSRRFNFSSIFFDEREGDSEPNMNQLPLAAAPTHTPVHDGYIVYQTSVHYDYHVPPTNAPWASAQYAHVQIPATVTTGHGHRFQKRQAERDADSEDACSSGTMYIAPKAALSDNSQWKFVVNVADRDPRFKQVIRVDVCRNQGGPCSNQVSLPFGYTSRCTQKYIRKNLLSVDPDGQGTGSEKFFIPSCCVCEIVRSNTN